MIIRKLKNFSRKARLFFVACRMYVNSPDLIPPSTENIRSRTIQVFQSRGMFVNAVEIPASADEFIKIVPVGNFPFHPDGSHEVTPEHIQQMARNFENSATDILVDIDHESLWFNTKAAGWITAVEARDDGLYVRYPEWTPATAELIANREYRYFSPVYYLSRLNNNGEDIGAVLDSVAITNRPYMENEIDTIKNSKTEATPMNEELKKLLIAKYELAEDASEEDIAAAVAADEEPAEEPAEVAEEEVKEPDEEVQADLQSIANGLNKLNSRMAAIENREQQSQEDRISAIVDAAVNSFKIKPREKQIWINSLKADFEGTKAILDGMVPNSVRRQPLAVKDQNGDGKSPKVNRTQAAVDFMKSQGRMPQA